MVEHTNTEIPEETDDDPNTPATVEVQGGETSLTDEAPGERKARLEISPGMDVYPQHLRVLEGAAVSSASGVGPMEIWVSYGVIWEDGECVGAFRRKRVGWDEARRLQELSREIDTCARNGQDIAEEKSRLTEIAVMPNGDLLSAAEALAEIPRDGRATIIRRSLKAVEEGGGAEEIERAVVLAGQIQNDDVQAPREVLEVSIWLLANHGEPPNGPEDALGWMLHYEEEAHGLTGLVAACDELFRAMTGRRPSSTYHSRVDRAGALRFRVEALAAAGTITASAEDGTESTEAGKGDGGAIHSAYVTHPDEDETALSVTSAETKDLSNNVDSLVVQLRDGFGDDLRDEPATHQDLDRIVDVLAQTRRDLQRVRQEALTLRSRIDHVETSIAKGTLGSQPGSGAVWNNIMLVLTVALFVGAVLLVWNESQNDPDGSTPPATKPGPAATASTANSNEAATSSAEIRTTPVEMPDEGEVAGASETALAGEATSSEVVASSSGAEAVEAKALAEEPVVEEAVAEEPVVEEIVVEEAVEAAAEEVAAPDAPTAEQPAAAAGGNAASPSEPVVVEGESSAQEAPEVAAERYGVGINPTHRLISRSKLYRFGARDFIPVTDLPGGDALVNACILSKAPVSAYRSRLYRGFNAIRLSCAGEMKVVCEILGCPAEQSCVTSASWVKSCK